MKQSAEHTTLRLACETLALLISTHVSVVTALLAQPDKCGAKVLRAVRSIERTVRQQLKIIYQLRAQALQSDLKTNPAFRARVASDLGGTLALIKWERRKRDAKTHQLFLAARKAPGLGSFCDPIQPSSNNNASELTHSKHASRADRAKPRKIWQPQTDRTGHFRLAVISTRTLATKSKPPKITTRIVKMPRQSPRPFSLIEVTPRELRVPSCPSSDYLPPPDIGMPLAGASPPIDRWPIN